MKMFADDAQMYRVITKDHGAESLQKDVDNLDKWSETWLLEFNASKCKVMHCGSSNPKTQYFMNKRSRKLEETLVERDLWVTVTNNLKPTQHCLIASRKATSAMALLKMSFISLTVQNFKTLFTTYVRPHLEYCIQVVGPYMVQDMQALEKVQRRATKLVQSIRHLPYEEQRRNFLKNVGVVSNVSCSFYPCNAHRRNVKFLENWGCTYNPTLH